MGYRLRLTDEQWDELDWLRFSTSSADLFCNNLIILMSHSRDTVVHHTKAVRTWLEAHADQISIY